MRHRLEYGLARLVFGLLGRAPRSSERLGATLGRLAHRLGWRRRVVEEQLGRAYPDRDETWVRRTARACFEHVGREWFTVPALVRLGLDEVRRRVELTEGGDELRAAFEEGRGVVVVSGHLGNWELAGSTLAALGYPVDAVWQRLKNRQLSYFVKQMRERLGIGLIERTDAWGRLMGSLAAGRVVAFVADQDARERGVFVPFFGRLASTHRAPALLALRAGAPFLLGGVRRVGARRYEAFVVRLEPPAGADVKEQVVALTRMWASELERRIRLSPEQYFWHHKRWKTVPPGTAAEGGGMNRQELRN
ncbi:MAG: lysophospholipid acyltransferase family protein [Gemmatimonadota bacterium]|nr:MAG: lysophospholipid acyltransferase family protein [Gemmatimonadota bacterium]